MTKKQLRKKKNNKIKSKKLKIMKKMRTKRKKAMKKMLNKMKRSSTKYSTIQNKLKERLKNKERTHFKIFSRRKTPFSTSPPG